MDSVIGNPFWGVFDDGLFKSLFKQLDRIIESKILDIFDLHAYTDLIYEDKCIDITENEFTPMSEFGGYYKERLIHLAGLFVIELWHYIKKVGMVGCIKTVQGIRSDKGNYLFEKMLSLMGEGIKYTVNKYNNVFSSYVINMATEVLQRLEACADISFVDGNEFRKAVAAAFDIISSAESISVEERMQRGFVALVMGLSQAIQLDQLSVVLFERIIKIISAIVDDGTPIINMMVDRFTEQDIDYFRQQARYFEGYTAELLNLDLERFKHDTEQYCRIAAQISSVKNDEEMNVLLKHILHGLGITMSWESTHDSFDAFMKDKKARMSFE